MWYNMAVMLNDRGQEQIALDAENSCREEARNMPGSQTAPVVEVSFDYKITLPLEIAQRFRPSDRFFVWSQGDTLILKRVTVPRVTDIVATTPETSPPLTMEEIDEIVHEARRHRARE
jgi:hypothetical protein